MAGCEASPTVFTERETTSWRTEQGLLGSPGLFSKAGTLHFHCKGGLDSIPVRERRFHKPHSAAKEKKRARPSCIWLYRSLFRGGKQRTVETAYMDSLSGRGQDNPR